MKAQYQIHNQEDAKELARHIIQRDKDILIAEENTKKEVRSFFSDLDINQIVTDENALELGVLLTLSEEEFTLLAPIFLEEIRKHYNTLPNRIELVHMLNMSDIKLEDLAKSYNEICLHLDEELTYKLSQQKRDFIKEYLSILYNTLMSAEGIATKVIKVPIERINPEVRLPEYAHDTDAGMDVFALEEITINPGETKIIPTGIKVAIPEGYELQVRPKSGRCVKTKLRVANTPGTIDSGYRDEIGIIVENIDSPIRNIHVEQFNDPNAPIPVGAIDFGQSYTIGKGEKFAQLVLSEIPKVSWLEVDDIHTIGGDRQGGFGSTGLK